MLPSSSRQQGPAALNTALWVYISPEENTEHSLCSDAVVPRGNALSFCYRSKVLSRLFISLLTWLCWSLGENGTQGGWHTRVHHRRMSRTRSSPGLLIPDPAPFSSTRDCLPSSGRVCKTTTSLLQLSKHVPNADPVLIPCWGVRCGGCTQERQQALSLRSPQLEGDRQAKGSLGEVVGVTASAPVGEGGCGLRLWAGVMSGEATLLAETRAQDTVQRAQVLGDLCETSHSSEWRIQGGNGVLRGDMGPSPRFSRPGWC